MSFPRADGSRDINTAYIERLHGTFRSTLVWLVRRGRAIAHQPSRLTAGRSLVGVGYNFCWAHQSLRLAAVPDSQPRGRQHKWQQRTPAMAAGLTDHPWTMEELLSYQVPWLPWVPPQRRGRPPKRLPPLIPKAPSS